MAARKNSPANKPTTPVRRSGAAAGSKCSLRFEGARVDGLFDVLDALAWLKDPDVGQIAAFAGIDPRTAGKLLKNCVTVGLIESRPHSGFGLSQPYPHKGALEEKHAVVREALIRMPLLVSVRQFLKLGEPLDISLRKGATVNGVENYDRAALSPLIDWATQFNALDPTVEVEDLLQEAAEAKEQRHRTDENKRVVFLSHSSLDKQFIRRLATDLTAAGVDVWLDEQNILVGDSIPEAIAQGLAASDFFLIALSEHSTKSEWVKRELNGALMREVSRRNVVVLPIKIGECNLPEPLLDKRYADFTKGYKEGLADLLTAIRAREVTGNGER